MPLRAQVTRRLSLRERRLQRPHTPRRRSSTTRARPAWNRLEEDRTAIPTCLKRQQPLPSPMPPRPSLSNSPPCRNSSRRIPAPPSLSRSFPTLRPSSPSSRSRSTTPTLPRRAPVRSPLAPSQASSLWSTTRTATPLYWRITAVPHQAQARSSTSPTSLRDGSRNHS